MRKLLPYEHQLIETLGITEEEYWQFYLAQQKYADVKTGTVLDIRNEVGTVALILTIVGTLAQVGAALLAPKPEVPDAAVAKRTRNAIFAPRYGFNSFQEVARYGDPINLVYTNRAENTTGGGLRVNTSLVWSAVQSFGTSQYIQMQAVVGAGEIEEFAYGRTAFGQATLRDFAAQRFWLYGNNNGSPLKFDDFKSVQGGSSLYDPALDGQSGGVPLYRASKGGTNIVDGFSQAFSPSSNNTLGLYSVVPINVWVLERKEDGTLLREKEGGIVKAKAKDELGIAIPSRTVNGTNYWPGDWFNQYGNGPRPAFPKDAEIELVFDEDDGRIREDAEEAALNYRSALISTIDASSLYKIGAAKFQLVRADNGRERRAEAKFGFKCVDAGVLCEEDYNIKSYLQKELDLEEDLELAKAQKSLLEEERATFGPLYTGAALAEFEALTAEFDTIEDNIEAATLILRGELANQELYEIIKDQGEFKGITRKIEALQGDIKSFNDRIDDLNDGIADELDRPRNERDRDRIRRLKERKKERQQDKKNTKDAIDKLFERLTTKAIEEGLFDEKPKTNLKEERRKLKRQKNRVKERLGKLAATLDRDTAAEQARDADWNSRYQTVQQTIADIEKQLRDPQRFNDHFNVKCLAKIDEITYSTITNCDIVDFAFKSKIFKRISGRQSVYGETKEPKHKDADNGLRPRTAMFWLLYKEAGSGNAYKRVRAIFAIRKGVEIDNYTGLRFVFTSKNKWTFKMEPIIDLAAELRTHTGGQDIPIAYIETRSYKNSGSGNTINIGGDGFIYFRGRLLQTENRLPPINRNPGFVDEWGVFSMRSDTQISFSFDNGPEIALAAVTEQQTQTFSPLLYQNLSMLGFNAYSGKGIQDLRSLSAYVTKGKKVRKINDDGSYGGITTSTSYAPEIFLDTVLDEENGIGAYANINGIDLPSLGLAMKFCKANNYCMDCVIAEPQAWREFWATVAPFSLLEFVKIGGREALLPAVPYDTYGKVSSIVTISALFNQGNILEDSYKEEFIDYGDNTEDLIATIVYRGTEDDDSFATNTSVELRLADADEASCIRQTFDLSNFVSLRTQAIQYGMLLCQQRRHSRRAVEFKTFPTESPVAPGSYIYVQTDQNQWDSLTSGVVEANGQLNLPLSEAITSASREALVYKGGQGVKNLGTISIVDNASEALLAYEGWLIVLGNQLTSKRVFRVTEVTMEEEGEVTIKASEHPCEEVGGTTFSKIVQFDANSFLIQ